MAWDSSRPVPWARLLREWLIYASIMAVVFVLFFRDAGLVGVIAGLLASGPLYLALGAVLAKIGYTRTRLRTRRTTAAAPDAGTPARPAAASRARPAPTRRTSTGPQRPRRKR